MLRHLLTEPQSPSRVVVLGGTGFVGHSLVSYLAQRDTAVLPLSSNDVDLTEPESTPTLQHHMMPGDALVIISAITPDKGRDLSTLMRNLEMGKNLSQYLENAQCSQVIYISSDAVYEDNTNPVSEQSSTNPSSFHGLMHLVRERILHNTLSNSETPFLIIRPSLLYGPGDTHNGYGPNRFLSSAHQGNPIQLFGNGEEKRDHVYIDDLSRLIGLCLSYKSSGLLNVATGQSPSFMEVATAVRNQFAQNISIETKPRENPITHRHFDTTLALKSFPSFRYIPVEEGIRKSIKLTSRSE